MRWPRTSGKYSGCAAKSVSIAAFVPFPAQPHIMSIMMCELPAVPTPLTQSSVSRAALSVGFPVFGFTKFRELVTQVMLFRACQSQAISPSATVLRILR